MNGTHGSKQPKQEAERLHHQQQPQSKEGKREGWWGCELSKPVSMAYFLKKKNRFFIIILWYPIYVYLIYFALKNLKTTHNIVYGFITKELLFLLTFILACL